MPTLAIGRSTISPAAEGGYTLLEIIVVLAIIGVLLALSSFVVPNSAADKLDLAAKRLLQTVQACRQGAVLSGTPTGVLLDSESYTPLQYRARWLPSSRAAEAPYQLPEGLGLDVTVTQGEPQIVCLPDGETLFTTFQLRHAVIGVYYEFEQDEFGEVAAHRVTPDS